MFSNDIDNIRHLSLCFFFSPYRKKSALIGKHRRLFKQHVPLFFALGSTKRLLYPVPMSSNLEKGYLPPHVTRLHVRSDLVGG